MKKYFLQKLCIITLCYLTTAQGGEVFTDFAHALETVEAVHNQDYNFDAKTVSMQGYNPLGATFNLKPNPTLKELFNDFEQAHSSSELGKWPILFPLHTCECDPFFNRTSAGNPSIRTSYEQTACCMLEQSYKARNKKTACFVSIGSGFLLTDFLIIDQFLTNNPIAQVILHCIDSNYTPYIGLLMLGQEQKNSILMSDGKIDFALKTVKGTKHFTQALIPNLSLILGNAEKTYSAAQKIGASSEDVLSEVQQITNVFLVHECVQTFLKLISTRHPQATIAIFIYDTVAQFEQNIKTNKMLPAYQPNFIGGIDAPYQDIYESEKTGAKGLKPEIVSLYQTCISLNLYPKNLFALVNHHMTTKKLDATTREKTLVLVRFFPSEDERPESLTDWAQENFENGSILLTTTFPSHIKNTENWTDQNGITHSYNIFVMEPKDFQKAREAINSLCIKK